MSDFTRTSQPKDERLERALDHINTLLADALEEEDARVEQPVFLVIGHQRCGSTLVSQYLCSALELGYPSNIVARFWRAPVVGITLQKALSTQLSGVASSFTSELGTTRGPLEPHEFSYFWNERFPGETECADERAFQRTLGNMERAFGCPLCFKNNFNSLRIQLLARLLPTAVFISVRRDLLDIACSTLNARRKRYGTDGAWFGVRPPACDDSKGLSPYAQIAAQIHYTEQAIVTGLAALPATRVIEVDYRAFCADPQTTAERVGAFGVNARPEANLPSSFLPTATSQGHPDAGALSEALSRFRG